MARTLRLFSVVGLLIAAGTSAAWAVPLAPDACSSLDQERHSLETSGVLDDVRATADMAKALPKDRLDRVERYVELSSLILFRCAPAVAAAPVAPPAGVAAASPVKSLAQPKGGTVKKKTSAN